MATEYFPGSSLSRGKLNSPCALLTTLMVIVEPARLALTHDALHRAFLLRGHFAGERRGSRR